MGSRLHRIVAVSLAALLAVAMFVGAAHAATHGADADCAVCVVSHHAPAVAASAAPSALPPLRAATVTIVTSEPALPPVRIARGGRAPPRTPSIRISRDA